MSTAKPVGWLRGVIFDCDDHRALATFWSDVLGVGMHKDRPDWCELEPGRGGVVMGFQPADDSRAPQGPVRFDIEVDDLDEGQAAMEARGASLVRIVHELDGEHHLLMADPEGNEFSLVLPFPPDW